MIETGALRFLVECFFGREGGPKAIEGAITLPYPGPPYLRASTGEEGGDIGKKKDDIRKYSQQRDTEEKVGKKKR